MERDQETVDLFHRRGIRTGDQEIRRFFLLLLKREKSYLLTS